MADRVVRVEGLRELQKAFALAGKEEERQLKDALGDAAKPVAVDAQALAVSRISRIGPTWSRMRIGVTRTAVYVAPAKRSRAAPARRRPNLAGRLLNDAMLPALDANRTQTEQRIDDMLGDVANLWGRGG